MGWTVNFANPYSILIFLISIVFIIAIPYIVKVFNRYNKRAVSIYTINGFWVHYTEGCMKWCHKKQKPRIIRYEA